MAPDDETAWIEAGGTMQDILGWPSPDELTFFIESEQGMSPIDTPRLGAANERAH